MRKNILYSFGLIVLFVGIGAILLQNDSVQKETFEYDGPIPGAINIDVSDLFDKYPDKSAEEIYTNRETWDRINPYIRNDDMSGKPTRPTPANDAGENYDYLAQDLNGNDRLIDTSINEQELSSKELTDNQTKQFEEAKTLASKYAPTMRIIVEHMRKSKIEDLIALTDPEIIKDEGIDDVRYIYSEIYAPFFQDFQSMDEDDGIISRYIPNEDIKEGMFFQETFTTVNGTKKIFLIVLIERDGKIYIESVLPNKTLEEYSQE